MVGRRGSPSARKGCVTRYSWAKGTTGTRTPASRPSSAAYMPPALTTTSASIAPFRLDAADTAVAHADPGHARVREDPHPPAARAVGQGVGQLRGVAVAVARQVGRRAPAVGHHQREELLRLARRDPLQRQPEGPR